MAAAGPMQGPTADALPHNSNNRIAVPNPQPGAAGTADTITLQGATAGQALPAWAAQRATHVGAARTAQPDPRRCPPPDEAGGGDRTVQLSQMTAADRKLLVKGVLRDSDQDHEEFLLAMRERLDRCPAQAVRQAVLQPHRQALQL